MIICFRPSNTVSGREVEQRRRRHEGRGRKRIPSLLSMESVTSRRDTRSMPGSNRFSDLREKLCSCCKETFDEYVHGWSAQEDSRQPPQYNTGNDRNRYAEQCNLMNYHGSVSNNYYNNNMRYQFENALRYQFENAFNYRNYMYGNNGYHGY